MRSGSTLVTLVVAAILSIVSIPHWSVAAAQLLALLGALGYSVTCLLCAQIDSGTQAGRLPSPSKPLPGAVCRAEPFRR